MKIQFVCTGNTYRSRLAEAYLKSKNISGLIVSSSGIAADRNLNGPIDDYTVLVLEKDNLIQFLSKTWRVTNKADLENQDLVIFLESVHYEFCINTLHCDIPKYEIWNIPDIPSNLLGKTLRNITEIIPVVESTFEKIKECVDQLVALIFCSK